MTRVKATCRKSNSTCLHSIIHIAMHCRMFVQISHLAYLVNSRVQPNGHTALQTISVIIQLYTCSWCCSYHCKTRLILQPYISCYTTNAYVYALHYEIEQRTEHHKEWVAYLIHRHCYTATTKMSSRATHSDLEHTLKSIIHQLYTNQCL